jgi:hypothetical protein
MILYDVVIHASYKLLWYDVVNFGTGLNPNPNLYGSLLVSRVMGQLQAWTLYDVDPFPLFAYLEVSLIMLTASLYVCYYP